MEIKTQQQILEKLGIKALNQMQLEALKEISNSPEVVLISPTGSGKTLAFLLPVIKQLEADKKKVQALILVPSRELATQIEQVARLMGSGFKTNAVYGGRSGYKDRVDLKHPPAILIGTPGRVIDHIESGAIDPSHIKTLVLDEFDKSLEIGFETEMKEIMGHLRSLKRKVLTSATQKTAIPKFMNLRDPKILTYEGQNSAQLTLKIAVSQSENKLSTLESLLRQVGDGRGIVFCNEKEYIENITDFLAVKNIGHACFYGGMEQMDRERALVKFRNGTHRILVATDLAARGLDIPELDFIIHFQMPPREDEFVHRNGRTARMHTDGTAYIIKWEREHLPEFVEGAEVVRLAAGKKPISSEWCTLYISGGRKDKISKGDVAGLFMKKGKLGPKELGMIELTQDCVYVAVPKHKSGKLIAELNNAKLKTKKVRVSLLE